MNPKRIGMVTEGPTDQVVLKILLPAALGGHGARDFVNIQPNPDNTSAGGGQEGGWRLVYKWCLANPPALRRQRFSEGGLFATSLPLDGFLVHLDADICEKLQKMTRVRSDDFDLATPAGRGQYIEAVLTDWLWPDGMDSQDRPWTFLAPAVEAVESWLLAGLTEDMVPEARKNPGLVLLEWDCKERRRPVPDKAKGISKHSDRYEEFSRRAAANMDRILHYCPHFAALTQKIAAF
ncbi:MAG: hypothetical protein HQL99_00010 [Magnetococcales bacterium]|nr:hypothetical protein [Magnetococcales bacterium]